MWPGFMRQQRRLNQEYPQGRGPYGPTQSSWGNYQQQMGGPPMGMGGRSQQPYTSPQQQMMQQVMQALMQQMLARQAPGPNRPAP